jgi:hypothetical protein
MISKSQLATVGLAVLATASGCSSQPKKTAEPPSMGQYRQNELESERQEFIREAQGRLGELDKEIAHLEVKIKHESPYVSADQRAEWSQELFERKREQAQVRAEIARAREVNAEEWEEMRGDLGSAIDTMEAGMMKLRDEVTTAFESPPQPPEPAADIKLRADAGLCPIDMVDIETKVERQNNTVTVVVQHDDDAEVTEVRRKARELASKRSYTPATSEQAASTAAPQPMAVRIRVQNVDDGVRITFVPNDPKQLDQLQKQVELDAAHLGRGLCETETRTGMR